MDANGVLQKIYDAANVRLGVTQVAGTPVRTGSRDDVDGVFGKVFDPATNTIRIVLV